MTNVRKSDLTNLKSIEAKLRAVLVEAYAGKLPLISMQRDAIRRDITAGTSHAYHERELLCALEDAQDMLRWLLRG